jgi:hypothetical protein
MGSPYHYLYEALFQDQIHIRSVYAEVFFISIIAFRYKDQV